MRNTREVCGVGVWCAAGVTGVPAGVPAGVSAGVSAFRPLLGRVALGCDPKAGLHFDQC